MGRQLSTSISDGILVWSVLYYIYNIFWTNLFSCLGIGIQGTAAALGVVRFAQMRQDGAIYDYHRMVSWLAQVLGVPLMAVGFCHKDLPVMMNLNIMFTMGVLIFSRFLAPGMKKLLSEACSGFAMLTIILICLRAINVYGLMAAALYILSGAIIGSEGKMSIFLRVDILHIGLSIANVLFAWAMLLL